MEIDFNAENYPCFFVKILPLEVGTKDIINTIDETGYYIT